MKYQVWNKKENRPASYNELKELLNPEGMQIYFSSVMELNGENAGIVEIIIDSGANEFEAREFLNTRQQPEVSEKDGCYIKGWVTAEDAIISIQEHALGKTHVDIDAFIKDIENIARPFKSLQPKGSEQKEEVKGDRYSCNGCIYNGTVNDDLCGTCGRLYENKTTAMIKPINNPNK